LREAELEALLALEFLSRGLIRNAAGKAFQAWKAYLAACAAEADYALAREFPGSTRVRSGDEVLEISNAELLIALVPTGKLIRIASVVAKAIGDPGILTWSHVALSLHRYQYNGSDPDLALSDYADDASAAESTCLLIGELARRLGSEELAKRLKETCG